MHKTIIKGLKTMITTGHIASLSKNVLKSASKNSMTGWLSDTITTGLVEK
jgi:hypothetical protein